jgi:hypothetical protein
VLKKQKKRKLGRKKIKQQHAQGRLEALLHPTGHLSVLATLLAELSTKFVSRFRRFLDAFLAGKRPLTDCVTKTFRKLGEKKFKIAKKWDLLFFHLRRKVW